MYMWHHLWREQWPLPDESIFFVGRDRIGLHWPLIMLQLVSMKQRDFNQLINLESLHSVVHNNKYQLIHYFDLRQAMLKDLV
jgi:hypothetical protein